MDRLSELLSSGAAPMELQYLPVSSFRDDSVIGYRSVLRLNSPDLGALFPEQYQAVANRDVRCIKLAQWSLERVCGDLRAFSISQNPEFFLVSAPVKMLMRGVLKTTLEQIFKATSFPFAGRLALEFEPELLFEDSAAVKQALDSVRALGVQTALSGYGGEYSPLLRLQGLPIDYILPDEQVTAMLLDGIPAGPQHVVTLAHDFGAKVIMYRIAGLDQHQAAGRLGADYYIEKADPAPLPVFTVEGERAV